MQSLSRALTVLAELNRQDRAYGVTELAVAVGLHKSTVHRILATFCDHGLARRVDDHLYSAADGLAVLRATPPQPGPDQLLTTVSTRLACLVVLARPLRRTTGTVLEVATVAGEGRGPTRAAGPEVRQGCAVSLRGSALGRAYLSALPVDEVDGTPDLHEALRRIRETGFAHNARQVAALPRMVAVPVLDGDGRCTGALGAELTEPISIDQIRRVVPALRRAAHQLAPRRRHGHRDGLRIEHTTEPVTVVGRRGA
ncbi:IclR family acetate operon transcriptional repressor [Kribbella amoyensis]|uniref:IclR family acetate operon transcriptional repressor n=1 Tax=Kribbella amoyensis TaxID=996641 RepID=A0A561B0M0_9ACTN|nr:helix-turn-helix domain-containing protein [Kribbella amoyensis]TWD72404.1 IclR family acetate operon transcriptional repressor [Kribbella amoyensis]